MLLVELVSQLLKKQYGVGVDARVLSLVDNRLEYFFHIGHIEVSAEKHIAGFPVVTSEEWVHVADSRLSCGAVTEVANIDFTCKRQLLIVL